MVIKDMAKTDVTEYSEGYSNGYDTCKKDADEEIQVLLTKWGGTITECDDVQKLKDYILEDLMKLSTLLQVK